MSRVTTAFQLTAAAILAIGQCVCEAQDTAAPPAPAMPGRLVSIGQHRLHLWCTGEGSPTVILEAGLGAYSIDWALVQPSVAKLTRVCSYDRAGYAWSDRGPEPRGLRISVTELHQLLRTAGEKAPYVLVGQSWGGRIVRVYAHSYADEVAGVVLIDTYAEGEADLPPAVLTALDPRAEEEQDAAVFLPMPFQVARRWAGSRPRQQDISDPDEPEAAIRSTTATATAPLGDKPLIVVSAGRLSWEDRDRASGKSYDAELRAHVRAEAFLAGLSRNSRFVVARASFHQVHLYEPNIVADAIAQVLTSVRTGRKLGAAR